MNKLILFFLMLTNQILGQGFLNFQLQQPRVAAANIESYSQVQQYFQNKRLDFPNNQIFWRAFKWNKALELWSYSADSQKYILVKLFPICEIVGDLGPKRQEGDFQIPEGFYYLENLNPNSKYHLSLKVSYPNKSDSILGNSNKLGGDIYIHGGCETIGCLPMTDKIIQEIYLINLYARANGQEQIPIHIFPTKLSLNNMNKLKKDYFNGQQEVLNFWMNLREGFEYFEKKKLIPIISVDDNGKYIFQ